jgi:hypothetical protein
MESLEACAGPPAIYLVQRLSHTPTVLCRVCTKKAPRILHTQCSI